MNADEKTALRARLRKKRVRTGSKRERKRIAKERAKIDKWA